MRNRRSLGALMLLVGSAAMGQPAPVITPATPATPGRPVVVEPGRPPVVSVATPDTRCPIPRRAHAKPTRPTSWRQGLYRDRVVIKFRDGLGLRTLAVGSGGPFAGTLRDLQDRQALARVNTVLRQARVQAARGGFSLGNERLLKLRELGQQRSCKALADLTQYFWVYLPRGSRADGLVDQLNANPLVEIAFLPPIPRNADNPPATDDFEGQQGYLGRARNQGIDALYAQDMPGGRGRDMKVIDIEATWNVNHEDLPQPFFFSGTPLVNEASTGINANDIDSHHGTAVMGVIVAKDDGHGVSGIASDARWGAASVVRAEALGGVLGWTSGIHDASVADATAKAIEELEPGDVILIEQHSQGPASNQACTGNCTQFEFVPMEYFPDSFDTFQLATSLGIHILEAAGNGTMNLDDPIYEGRFDRKQRDSGAIMVGGSSSTQRGPNGSSNSGSRLDVHAWGQNVTTTGYGDVRANGDDVNQFYTNTFSGTSSATPIASGAVLSLQGILKQNGHGILTPQQMRELLTRTGVPQDTTLARRIGPHVNLRNALREFDSVTAPVGGDGGDPFELRCAPGLSMAGVKGRAGAWIDQLQPICLSSAGETRPVAAAGGGGGTAFERRCANGQFVVGMRGRAGAFVDSLVFECQAPTGPRTVVQRLDAVGGTGGAVFGSNRCSNDRTAVGFRGRAGGFIDRVQLLCSAELPATTVDTPWVSHPVGGNGGTAATLSCGAGTVMVGITARSDAWLDQIGVTCVQVNPTGNWVGATFGTATAGGGGGTARTLTCPRDQAVSAISGRAGGFIDRLRVRCKALDSATTVTGDEDVLGRVGGNGGTEFGVIRCPAQLAATGFAVRAGGYVDQLKLRCGN
jgi:serine protease